MPLWDSVQRGLEKASQEAARIARTQRLRAIIDGLSRQLNMQHNAILNKTMDLFVAGQLTQSELLPLCQEMLNLQQQLNQAQNELRQIQAQQTPPPPPGGPQTQTGPANLYLPAASYPSPDEGDTSTTYAPPPPPDYQTYMASTQAAGIPHVPPPPPGMEPMTISSIETIHMHTSPATEETRICTVCQAELLPNHAFCHNCGSPIQTSSPAHLPTMRAGYMPTPSNSDTEETRRANPPGYSPMTPANDASGQEAAHNEGI